MFEGCYTAIVTPFTQGKIDEAAFLKLIERQIQAGVSGIVPCGTTGESPTLSHEEHKRVIELTIKQVAGRVKVIAGAGSNSTAEAIDLTRFAKQAGADAALVITPYYNKPTQRGLYLHFEAIAQEVDIPIILYNVPGRTAVNIEIDTLTALSELPGIVGIKEASGSVERVTRILDKTNLCVLSGDDALTYPMMAVGAKGVISVTSNVLPGLMSDMVKAILKGDFHKGLELHKKLAGINTKLFLETNPIPVKAALAILGLIQEELRLPLCSMSVEKKKFLEEELLKFHPEHLK